MVTNTQRKKTHSNTTQDQEFSKPLRNRCSSLTFQSGLCSQKCCRSPSPLIPALAPVTPSSQDGPLSLKNNVSITCTEDNHSSKTHKDLTKAPQIPHYRQETGVR